MIDPVAIRLFGIDLHWYGILWVVGFLLARFAAIKLGPSLVAKKNFGRDQIDELCFFTLLAAFCGGRIGYALFYGIDRFLENPLWLLRVNEGGMSFHGGVAAVVAMLVWYAKRCQLSLFRVADVICLATPLALACGRLGNFINGELWGKATDLPWGMVFPAAGEQARHPSQLYEMLGEGLLLFIALWIIAKSKPAAGTVSAAFLTGYGLVRFLIEFLREPDAHIGYLAGGLSAGQWLSIPMMVAGVIVFVLARRRAHAGD